MVNTCSYRLDGNNVDLLRTASVKRQGPISVHSSLRLLFAVEHVYLPELCYKTAAREPVRWAVSKLPPKLPFETNNELI